MSFPSIRGCQNYEPNHDQTECVHIKMEGTYLIYVDVHVITNEQHIKLFKRHMNLF